MDIKVGDIVEYNGKQQRVMGLTRDNKVRLSDEGQFRFIDTGLITLIQSFVIPDIKVGDWVIIQKIPPNEQGFYNNANDPIDDNIYKVVETWGDKLTGFVVSIDIDGLVKHYMTHYVEKIDDYDIL